MLSRRNATQQVESMIRAASASSLRHGEMPFAAVRRGSGLLPETSPRVHCNRRRIRGVCVCVCVHLGSVGGGRDTLPSSASFSRTRTRALLPCAPRMEGRNSWLFQRRM